MRDLAGGPENVNLVEVLGENRPRGGAKPGKYSRAAVPANAILVEARDNAGLVEVPKGAPALRGTKGVRAVQRRQRTTGLAEGCYFMYRSRNIK